MTPRAPRQRMVSRCVRHTIDRARSAAQQPPRTRRASRRAARGIAGVADPRPPTAPSAADLAHQPVRRLVEVVGHLHREAAARRQPARGARGRSVVVVGQPLQHGVGEDHVERRRRLAQAAMSARLEARRPAAARAPAAIMSRRAVEADDARPARTARRRAARSSCPGRSRGRPRCRPGRSAPGRGARRKARVRSSSNRRYSAADQSIAIPLAARDSCRRHDFGQ